MSRQIEDMIARCAVCKKYQSKPPREPMVIHPIPTLPWEKVGTDIGVVDGKHFMVLVDYYSNFIEAIPLQELNSRSVIRSIKTNIARYGIMKTLISDNGPQYASEEFKQFTNSYGITHIT